MGMLRRGGHCPGNPALDIKDRHPEVSGAQILSMPRKHDTLKGQQWLLGRELPGPGIQGLTCSLVLSAGIQHSQPRSGDLPGVP